jgi:hypothetical protein
MVVVVALAVYAIAATVDRWPELVIAAWGAALGAGLAINRIALHELDISRDGATAARAAGRAAVLQHQFSLVVVAITAWQTAAIEHVAWAAATIVCGFTWAWTLSRVAAELQHATRTDAMFAYFRAFQVVAVLFAVAGIYASVALESPWLWRPAAPAELQWLVWLTILEFASLPLTFLVLRS